MAWTWSAQRRGNFAFGPAAAVDPDAMARPPQRLSADTVKRGTFVAAAAGLTLGGLAIPLMATETLSSLMFLGGALVALLALRPPLDTASRRATAAASVAKHPSPCEARREDRFLELFARPDHASTLDREAWARLTAHMSHELRTPLNAVLGFSELMSKEVFGPMGSSCYSDYARDIHASGRMLLKSAEDALAITALLTAPPIKGAMPTSKLSASMQDALAFHAAAIASRNIALNARFSDDDMIVADAQTVRQLLINVVAEMLDRAGPRSGLDIRTAQAGGQIRIAVTLSGATAPTVADPAASFNIQLARTLADLSGAQISGSQPSAGEIEMTVEFAPAAQCDFFAAG